LLIWFSYQSTPNTQFNYKNFKLIVHLEELKIRHQYKNPSWKW